jgi:hypothetical protein
MAKNFYNISTFHLLKCLIFNGYFGLIFRELRRRIYSDRYFLISAREVAVPLEIPEPKIKLSLRPLKPEDIPQLLNIDRKGMKDDEVLERIRLLRLLSAGLEECYVVETEEGIPCHISWWITASQNPVLKKLFQGRILPLADDEVLVEGAFTLEAYQRLGILTWRRFQFLQKSLAVNTSRHISYIRHDNLPSLYFNKKEGFKLFLIRKDTWRFFRQRFFFKALPEDTPYPLTEKGLSELMNSGS